jgi:class 3 adenylate cyclase/tetratricopeptide (TPR) repeat protein
MPFCINCGTENPAQARFCLACGTQLAEAPAPTPPSEERKIITAIFVDLVGSTARSEQLDPEDVKALVAPYHARVRAELERHGGTFEKFSGDAILALFGSPKAHEDDPERSVRAGLAVKKAIAELNAEDQWLDLHIRIGIHTGEALVMLGARPSEGEWSAAGDVLNTAARIQSAAPTDGILVGEQTYQAAEHAFEFREAEPIQAKGKSEPVLVWEVVAEREMAAAARPRSELQFIGRLDELEELSGFTERVLEDGHVGIATIVGSPGIGKSRLLLELVHRLEDRCDVHWGRCLSYGEGITYWPVEEIVEDAAGIVRDDDAEATAAKLAGLLESLGTSDKDELRSIAASVSNLTGAATTPLGTYSAVEIGQTELHWGIRRLLELRAERHPTAIVIEDLHWAEPTLLELLSFIGQSTVEAPLLILGTARPEARDSGTTLFTPDERRHVLELDALNSKDSVMLIAELVPAGVQVPVDRLLEAAGGNPLFLEETVRMISEAGESPEGEELPVPSNLNALITSRLDQLGPTEKALAQNASVIGTTFWPDAVAAMNGIAGDLEEGLAELQQRDLVRPGGPSRITGEREFAFKHVLIRDVAYGQLPKGRRAVLHRKFADWVAELPRVEDELSEIIAYHFEQACLTAQTVARPLESPPVVAAVEALMRAAGKAERREGFREAERFYTRALELAEDTEVALRSELRYRRARMLVGRGDLKFAREELTQVADATAAAEMPDLRCAVLLTLANADSKQGLAADERERLAEAAELAQQVGDRRLEILVAFELANVRAWFDREAAAAVDDLRDALERARAYGDRPLLTEACMRLGSELYNLGLLTGAEEQFEQAVALAGEEGSHRDEARATTLLGRVKYLRGEVALAEELAMQALDWLERTGDTFLQIQNLRWLSRYEIDRGDLDCAERRLRDALPLALEVGGWLTIDIYRHLAEVLVRSGRLGDARELVAFAARSIPEEDHYARAAHLVGEAIVATGGGESTTAATAFAEALRLMEEQELVIDVGETRIELARSLRAFGDLGGARAELERARAAFVRMEARAMVEQIDRELAELAEQAEAGSLGAPR